MTVTIADDDERGVIVEPRVLSFPEGERRTYTVVLTSEQTDAVVVSTDVSGDRDVTTGAVSLTFPPYLLAAASVASETVKSGSAGMAYYHPVAEDGPRGVATGADRCAEPLMGTCGLIADS